MRQVPAAGQWGAGDSRWANGQMKAATVTAMGRTAARPDASWGRDIEWSPAPSPTSRSSSQQWSVQMPSPDEASLREVLLVHRI